MKRLLSVCAMGCLLAGSTGASAGEPGLFPSYGRRAKPIASPRRPARWTSGVSSLFGRSFIVKTATNPVPPAPGVEPDYQPIPQSATRYLQTEPMPYSQIEPLPAGVPGGVDFMELYHRVKYEDKHNIHPCAVTKIVRVMDPCYDPRACCEPRCVYVQICVPPCGCPPKIKVSRRGRKVKYDYGEYEVELVSKKGTVYVDYDD